MMPTKMVMGNEAIALGALCAGVNVVSGYPGTPSSEIIEFISKYRNETGTYVEWSVNEKAACEVASGASLAGSRALVTMKQVGLNVAGDPLMCLSYVGVKGGVVIVVADDPGPISSQTEQDTRRYGSFSKIPVFDPSSPEEAFEMTKEAFDFSEKHNTPVIVRPTTRIDHGYASMELPSLPKARPIEGFEKDSARWVIFPRTSFLNHKRIFSRNEFDLPLELSENHFNFIENSDSTLKKGIASGGAGYAYAKEALELLGRTDIPLLKIGTPYPFPSSLAEKFFSHVQEVLVIEELDPVIENELLLFSGKKHLSNTVRGKLSSDVPEAGELSVECVKHSIASFLGLAIEENKVELPFLPARPPVLCAGCPHRASFFAVKQAMKNQKTVFCGDIGCYTLGNALPLDMCDTCLCMGAGITMAQGFSHAEKDRICFSFIGDSTFFASGVPGVINAVYNQAKQVICVLDNSTTAMTGHQPHPGTGKTMMGEITEKISIEKLLLAVGVSPVITVNPFDLEESIRVVKECAQSNGVSAIIFRSPCIALLRKDEFKEYRKHPLFVDKDKCTGCKKCINELGCPALSFAKAEGASPGSSKVLIDSSLCTGCSLCSQVCAFGAIKGYSGEKNED